MTGSEELGQGSANQKPRRSRFKADQTDFGLAAEDPNWDASWQAYSDGENLEPSSYFGELKAVVQLPIGQAELWGDFDESILSVLADLTVQGLTPRSVLEEASDAGTWDEVVNTPRLSLRWIKESAQEDPPSAGLEPLPARGSQVQPIARWQLGKDEVEVIASGNGVQELLLTLWSELLTISRELDPTALHLRVPCLELNGHGLVIAGGTTDERSELTDELIRCGAHYLTADDLILLDGTRTVFGASGPLVVSGPDEEPRYQAASSIAQLVPQCAVGMILVLTETEVEPQPEPAFEQSPQSTLTPLSMAKTTSKLMACLPDGPSRQFPGSELALEMVAQLVAGATCVSAATPRTPAQVHRVVQDLLGLLPPDRRRLALRYCLAESLERNTRGPEQAVLTSQLIRFDQDALLLKAKSGEESELGTNLSLAESEPELLTAERADELVAHSLPLLAIQRPKVWPTPSAFGLNDCPTGPTAQSLWSGLDLSVNDQLGDLPSGVAVELLSRDLLLVPTATRDKVLRRHVLAQGHADEVAVALLRVQQVASDAGVRPVVFGSLLQVFDGRVPEHFTDLRQLDLLIRSNEIDRLLDRLASHGFEAQPRKLSQKPGGSQVEYQIHQPDISDVVINLHLTLAAGPFAMLVDPEEFHQRAVPVAVRDQWVLGLHPEHRFVAACVAAFADGATQGSREDSSALEGSDSGSSVASIAQLREVVLTAPRSEPLLASAVECSSRLGATAKVFSAVRQAEEVLTGLPPWLVRRARHEVNLPKERPASLRARLRGRKL